MDVSRDVAYVFIGLNEVASGTGFNATVLDVFPESLEKNLRLLAARLKRWPRSAVVLPMSADRYGYRPDAQDQYERHLICTYDILIEEGISVINADNFGGDHFADAHFFEGQTLFKERGKAFGNGGLGGWFHDWNQQVITPVTETGVG